MGKSVVFVGRCAILKWEIFVGSGCEVGAKPFGVVVMEGCVMKSPTVGFLASIS